MKLTSDAVAAAQKNRPCGRSSKRTGNPCKNPAMPGTDPPRCDIHITPSTRNRVARQRNDAAIVEVITNYHPDVALTNPLSALSEVSDEVLQVKNQFAAKAQELIAQGRARYEDDKGGEQLRSEIAMYERSLDRAVNTLATIAKLNIDERLAMVQEQQVDLVDRAITAALIEAGLTGPQQQQIRVLTAHRLRSAIEFATKRSR